MTSEHQLKGLSIWNGVAFVQERRVLFCFIITTGGASPPEHEGGHKPKTLYASTQMHRENINSDWAFIGSFLQRFQRLKTSRMSDDDHV